MSDRKSLKKDSHSKVFAALKHSIRRQIMRMLSEGSKSYTELLNSLGIDSPRLNYHLQALGDMVSKNERGEYFLSSLGESVISLLGEVKPPISSSRFEVWEKIQVAGTILMMVGITFMLFGLIRIEQPPSWFIEESQGLIYHIFTPSTQVYPFSSFFEFGTIIIAVSLALMLYAMFKRHVCSRSNRVRNSCSILSIIGI